MKDVVWTCQNGQRHIGVQISSIKQKKSILMQPLPDKLIHTKDPEKLYPLNDSLHKSTCTKNLT